MSLSFLFLHILYFCIFVPEKEPKCDVHESRLPFRIADLHWRNYRNDRKSRDRCPRKLQLRPLAQARPRAEALQLPHLFLPVRSAYRFFRHGTLTLGEDSQNHQL